MKAVNDALAREENFLMQLAAIDPTGFTDQEKTSRDLLLRRFAEDEEAAEFKEWEMPLNQMSGMHTTYPQLVAAAQLHHREGLRRLDRPPARHSQGLRAGDDQHVHRHGRPSRAAPVSAGKGARSGQGAGQPEARRLAAGPAAQELSRRRFQPAEQERIKAEMLDAIGKEVLPAYLRFARFLEVSYVPAGREQPGISALPDGAKYYQFLIRRTTTTNLTADQIHQIGLDEVKRDEAEMLAIAQKLGFADLKSFRASLKTNPKLHPASRRGAARSLSRLSRPHAGQAAAALRPPAQSALRGRCGSRLPGEDLRARLLSRPARPTAAAPAASSSTPTTPPTATSTPSRPSPTTRAFPATTCKSPSPRNSTACPPSASMSGYTAYIEGWGLYAERLGKDVGFYQDPYSDYGRLEADIWRAIRLVVDTGVHSQHWTRQQMVDYFHDHSAIDETSIQAEVDRYIAWPGQALAYKIGQLKILELRDRAKKALGDKFDLRAFHDQVLDSGALPLDVLSDRIDAWIAAQKSAAPQ